MVGSELTQNMLLLGNVIANVIKGKDVSDISPDIVAKGRVTRLMSKFMIVPNIIVDESIKYMDSTYYKNLIKTEMNIFTGIVTESIRILVELHGVEPQVAIRTMSGGRDVEESILDHRAIVTSIVGNESHDPLTSLMFTDKEDVKGFPTLVGNEASSLINNAFIQKDNDTFYNVYELQLSIDVPNDTRSKVIVIPIVIYPNITFTNGNDLIENLLGNDPVPSFTDRWLDYSAGAISLFDLVFATDLVKKYKDDKLNSNNDVASYLNKVDKTTAVSDVLRNENSYSKNFNIFILNSSRKRLLEKKVGGSVLTNKHKNILTEKLSAFSVSLVDLEEEEILFLLDSIPGFSVLNFGMLKKEKDGDVKDIIKSIITNKQPF